MVVRFDSNKWIVGMRRTPDGYFVKHEDYEELQAENKRQAEEIKRLKEEIIAAIELLELAIRNAETGTPMWESVGDVQDNLDQALKGE